MNGHTRILASAISSLKHFVRYSCFPANFLNYLNQMPSMQYSKIQNGLNVATEERNCYNVCIGFFFDNGSRYENPSENGISHFFEHLAFKETKTRSKTVLEEQISSTGARIKCYTTREMVGFYAECLCEDVPCVYDILTDCLFNNNLSKSEIEIQKNTVYLEMLEHDKNTKNLVFDYLHAAAFQGTPLAQTVMGPSCNLYNFNSETISSYRARAMDPTKIVLAAVGGVKHEHLLQLATSLDKLPTGKCITPYPCRYTGSQINYRDDSMAVAHVAIALEGPRFCSPDYITMSLAATIVGGWDKSQPGGLDLSHLVARSASTSQLCESYNAFYIAYYDTGLWGIEFVSPKLVVDDMLSVVQDQWMKLCIMVSEGELERAKAELKTKYLTNNQSTAKTCRAIGKWLLYNKYKTTLNENLCAIDAVKVNDIKETCYKYIYDKCPAVAAVGSTECLPDYTRIRAGMYWLRY